MQRRFNFFVILPRHSEFWCCEISGILALCKKNIVADSEQSEIVAWSIFSFASSKNHRVRNVFYNSDACHKHHPYRRLRPPPPPTEDSFRHLCTHTFRTWWIFGFKLAKKNRPRQFSLKLQTALNLPQTFFFLQRARSFAWSLQDKNRSLSLKALHPSIFGEWSEIRSFLVTICQRLRRENHLCRSLGWWWWDHYLDGGGESFNVGNPWKRKIAKNVKKHNYF